MTAFTGRTGLALTAVRFADTRFTGRLVRRLAARPVRAVRAVLVARMVFTLTGYRSSAAWLLVRLYVLTSCAERSAYPYACSCGSSCPASGKPQASAGDSPSPCLLLRRADDPQRSCPRRAQCA